MLLLRTLVAVAVGHAQLVASVAMEIPRREPTYHLPANKNLKKNLFRNFVILLLHNKEPWIEKLCRVLFGFLSRFLLRATKHLFAKSNTPSVALHFPTHSGFAPVLLLHLGEGTDPVRVLVELELETFQAELVEDPVRSVQLQQDATLRGTSRSSPQHTDARCMRSTKFCGPNSENALIAHQVAWLFSTAFHCVHRARGAHLGGVLDVFGGVSVALLQPAPLLPQPAGPRQLFPQLPAPVLARRVPRVARALRLC